MASIIDVLAKIDPNKISYQNVNQSLMKVSKKTKNKSGYIQIAVPDETAENYLSFSKVKELGFLFQIDGEEWDKALKAVKEENGIE